MATKKKAVEGFDEEAVVRDVTGETAMRWPQVAQVDGATAVSVGGRCYTRNANGVFVVKNEDVPALLAHGMVMV